MRGSNVGRLRLFTVWMKFFLSSRAAGRSLEYSLMRFTNLSPRPPFQNEEKNRKKEQEKKNGNADIIGLEDDSCYNNSLMNYTHTHLSLQLFVCDCQCLDYSVIISSNLCMTYFLSFPSSASLSSHGFVTLIRPIIK